MKVIIGLVKITNLSKCGTHLPDMGLNFINKFTGFGANVMRRSHNISVLVYLQGLRLHTSTANSKDHCSARHMHGIS